MLTACRHTLVLFKSPPGRVALSVCAGLELRPIESARSQFPKPPDTLRDRFPTARPSLTSRLRTGCQGGAPVPAGCIAYQYPERAYRQTAAARLR